MSVVPCPLAVMFHDAFDAVDLLRSRMSFE